MNTENLKEVQLKNNKMISKGHFMEKCSWLANKNSSKKIDVDNKDIIEGPIYASKEEYLSLITNELELIFSSKEFTKKDKRELYEITNEAYWRYKLKVQKK